MDILCVIKHEEEHDPAAVTDRETFQEQATFCCYHVATYPFICNRCVVIALSLDIWEKGGGWNKASGFLELLSKFTHENLL